MNQKETISANKEFIELMKKGGNESHLIPVLEAFDEASELAIEREEIIYKLSLISQLDITDHFKEHEELLIEIHQTEEKIFSILTTLTI